MTRLAVLHGSSTTWFQTSHYCRAKVEFNTINWVGHGSSTAFEMGLSFFREVLQIQPNHCFYLCAIFCFQGTRHYNITLHLLILSWGEHKLKSKSESYSSMTSSSFSSSYIGGFIAHASGLRWAQNVPAENFVVCCLTVSCRTYCPCSLTYSLVLSMGTTGIWFNFAIAERSIVSSGRENRISSGWSIW